MSKGPPLDSCNSIFFRPIGMCTIGFYVPRVLKSEVDCVREVRCHLVGVSV